MTERSPNRYFAILLAAMAVLLVAACAATPGAGSGGEKNAASAKPTVSVEPWDGDGMEIPLDGSSLEAWGRSLDRVKAHAHPKDYDVLMSALEFMLLYDLGARQDPALLAKRLDGLTGYQVVDRAHQMRGAPKRSRTHAPSTTEGDATRH